MELKEGKLFRRDVYNIIQLIHRNFTGIRPGHCFEALQKPLISKLYEKLSNSKTHKKSCVLICNQTKNVTFPNKNEKIQNAMILLNCDIINAILWGFPVDQW